MTEYCAQRCLEEWHSGLVDGLVLGVFFVLLVLAFSIGYALTESQRSP